MNTELVRAVHTYVDAHPEVVCLPAEEAELFRLALAEAFAFPAAKRWWWESLPATARSLDYSGDNAAAWRTFMLETLPADGLRLFVTDDESPPWICVAGSRDSLL